MATLQTVSWKDIRQEVYQQNQEIAEIIDQLDPDDSFKLYLGVYAYGEYIITRGVFNVPNSMGTMDQITSSCVPNEIKEQLGYNFFTNPVSLVLQNTLEIFYIINGCTIPVYGLVRPGSLISTWKAISDFESHGPAFLWDMTSGARSIFMLSKVADAAGNKRLKKHFDLLLTGRPKTFMSQWDVFRAIAAHETIKNKWESKILFFGKKWFENLNDPLFNRFYLYLLKNAWKGSNYFRHQFIWDLIYSVIQDRNNIRAEAYIIDTVKHLIAVSIGSAPAFTVAIDDFAAPVSILSSIYRDIYQLKNYAPIFMHPHNFSLSENRPVYYSLDYPTALSFSVRLNDENSKIQDLLSTKSIMSKFLNEIKYGNLNIGNTPILKTVDLVNFDYYHSIDGFHQVKNIENLLKNDLQFSIALDRNMAKFPVHSSFLKGCIKLSLSRNNEK